MRSIASVLLMTMVLGGCASSPNAGSTTTRVRVFDPHDAQPLDVDLRTHATSDDRVLSLPVVAAFDAIPAAYRELGIATVAVVDTSGGVYTIGARNLRLHGALGGVKLSRYVDCGGAAMRVPADTYDVTFSATSYATPSGSGSILHTLVLADARDPAANAPPVHCASTGGFEHAVANAVSRAAGK